MLHLRRLRQTLTATVLLVALVGVYACTGQLAAPPQLTPVGVTAFHADRAIKGVGVLQDITIAGEAQGAIPRNDARAILEATEIAGKSGQELAGLLRLTLPQPDARQRALAVIRQALTSLPARLSEATRRLVDPYITVILTALAFVE